MMKSRAPPDKVGVLHHLLPMEFHGFTTELSLSSVKLRGQFTHRRHDTTRHDSMRHDPFFRSLYNQMDQFTHMQHDNVLSSR